ncbi:pro-sigmaK processing inhibitor BofA family protein [Bacillus sp. SL00103]
MSLIEIKFAWCSFLFCLNLFGRESRDYVSINPVTSGISGLLGIPGVAALV